MYEKIITYVFVLIGAYLVIWTQAVMGEPLKWYDPLVWVFVWVVIELVGYWIETARRKRGLRKSNA